MSIKEMKTLTIGDTTYEIVDNEALHYSAQSLTEEQKAQVKTNIGVYVQAEEPTDAVEGDIWVDADAESHLDPEIVIDSTLTQSGQAADAKVVGEKISNHQTEINSLFNEIANKVQLEPEFANSIEECVDTSKVYVLPDGYIYANVRHEGALFTNQLRNAVDTDGNPYNNGLGYEVGHLGGNGSESDREDGEIRSGFIPYTHCNLLRITGLKGDITSTTHQVGKVIYFDKDRNFQTVTAFNDAVSEGYATYVEDGYNGTGVFTLNFDEYASSHGWWGSEIPKATKYIRVNWEYECYPEEAAVTFDEELTFGVSYAWENTGHAFVPTDYEDRIISLEETAEENANRIKRLENDVDVESEEIPIYIKDSAEEVISKVIEAQGNTAFNLIAISDFHYNDCYNGAVNKTSLIHASKAIQYIKNRINIDAIATLGDNMQLVQGDEVSMERAHRWGREINAILERTQGVGIINFRTPGNHDRMGGKDDNGNATAILPDNTVHSYITGYNRQLTYNNVPVGYGYHDFNNYNLRVILLNTAECEGVARFDEHGAFRISTKQYNWLIESLDLTGKPNAEEWKILIMAHNSPDDAQENCMENGWHNGYILPNILYAYTQGTSFTGTREDGDIITCNFNGKNTAKLIGAIHGHHHDYKYGDVYLGDVGAGSLLTNIKHIGTPTSQFVTNGNADNDGNTYSSVKDTASETAFCVYSIDLDNHVIHAIHYGNGVDREISY